MSIAKPNQVNRMAGIYVPERDNPRLPGRPGQDDHQDCGSRMGDWLHFRDGTKKHISET